MAIVSKGGPAPAAAKRRTVIARITRERDEALEQLFATSEVLKVIGSSPGGFQPRFGAVLQNAMRICEANFGNLLLVRPCETRLDVDDWHNWDFARRPLVGRYWR